MGKFKDIPNNVFENAVKESKSLQEVVEKLGYSKASGSMGKFVKQRDHRITNLCFLCPNCHSQTDIYLGKNKGRYA